MLAGDEKILCGCAWRQATELPHPLIQYKSLKLFHCNSGFQGIFHEGALLPTSHEFLQEPHTHNQLFYQC